MSLDFILSAPCAVCGHILRGMSFRGGCRVNKNSIVTGRGLTALPMGHGRPSCPECGTNNGRIDRCVSVLTPESLATVNRHRAKRGWEPIAA